MLIFNGRLVIKTCETTAVDQWSVTATFTDNTGRFTARDAAVGNRIYAKASNEAGDSAMCAFRVTSIVAAATTANVLTCVVQFDEHYSSVADVYTPDVDDDAVICAVSSEVGFSLVPGDVSGLPQDVLDNMRNMGLVQRDERFGDKLNTMFENLGSGSNLTLGGTIDGDLDVTGKVTAGNGFRVTNSTGAEVGTLTASETKIALNGDAPVLNVSVNAARTATPTLSVVSTGDIAATEVFNATTDASRKTTITGVSSAADDEEVVSRGTAQWAAKANGTTAVSSLTAAGVTSADVTVAATVSDVNGTSKITLDAKATQATGQLSAAGIVSSGTVAGAKFMLSGEEAQTDPENQELVTADYMRRYVLANTTSSDISDELSAALNAKANAADVYTKTETNAMVSGLSLADLKDDDAHRTVSDAQIEVWSGKQAALGFTPENIENKGVANGYASLDKDGVLATSQVNVTRVNELIDARFGELDLSVLPTTDERQFVSSEQIAAWDAKQDKLTFTPEDVTNKGIANGYAALNGDGVVPALQMNDPHINGLIDAKISEISADDVAPTAERQYVTGDQVAAWDAKQDALGFTPENLINRGQPNGYAELNADGVVPAEQMNQKTIKSAVDESIALLTLDVITDTPQHRTVTDEQIALWTNGIGYTAEDVANKGQANGYASLDVNGKVPVSQLDMSNYSPIVTSLDGLYSFDTNSATQLVFTGVTTENVVDDLSLQFVNDDGDLVQAGELSTTSSLRVPWTLISRLPQVLETILTNEGVGSESMLPVEGLIAGTYTSVRVDEHGLVVEGNNPETVDATGTHATHFTIGVDEFNKTDNVVLYADAGRERNPFIRYNINTRRWEFSNNGHDIYGFSDTDVIFKEGMDLGYVYEELDEEIDCGSVADGNVEGPIIDFNGDVFAVI